MKHVSDNVGLLQTQVIELRRLLDVERQKPSAAEFKRQLAAILAEADRMVQSGKPEAVIGELVMSRTYHFARTVGLTSFGVLGETTIFDPALMEIVNGERLGRTREVEYVQPGYMDGSQVAQVAYVTATGR